MEENYPHQPRSRTDERTLQQNPEENSLLPESSEHPSNQLDNVGNLAQSLLESATETKSVQNLTGSMQNLFPKNFQNLTGSPFFEDSCPQTREKGSRPFMPRCRRDSQNDLDNIFQTEQSRINNRYQPYQFKSPRYSPWQGQCGDIPSPVSKSFRNNDTGENISQRKEKPYSENKREKKEKKSVSTKTFAHGMMDVSLLTSNATQLRAVLSNPEYEFYTLLLWLIGLSIVLQILSAVLLIMSDFFKTQVKEKDRQNQRKRKVLNFLSLTLVTIVMSLNVLISAFSTPSYPQQISQQKVNVEVPVFSSPDIHGAHSEL
ncbi:uncharacterized protein LOC123526490 [Mercenaria mercenaria]|uniref:uncharacterized protein LOC123526490 n=1 Tax=Mercenaria mercenaria TaxID=6596 RepID=UPI00234E6724|nr:uncharacterized protein LOC123526490 [Mercenaria mercenaria]XP_045161598.2 uncharacterized protein LOC123526490 [Mercenaria mercenaria]XP_053378973.1 uncharacterized protein LOC123526490 [Mercenaria mercenaria]XP_053378974.1 uncharacterized protein LOC123526490 [Mercenaria mercenaria]